MAGIPPNVIPANVDQLAAGQVSGVVTQAQQIATDAINNALGTTGTAATAAVAEAQAQIAEQLNSLSQRLQLPPDALASLALLQTLFSYDDLVELDIEEIKRRIKAIKITFKVSRPKLPEIPELSIPSTAEIVDRLIPNLPNDSGLDAFSDNIINQIKQLRQEAQSKFEQESANRARNMFQLRQDLIQEESQKLLSGFLSKANITTGIPTSLG